MASRQIANHFSEKARFNATACQTSRFPFQIISLERPIVNITKRLVRMFAQTGAVSGADSKYIDQTPSRSLHGGSYHFSLRLSLYYICSFTILPAPCFPSIIALHVISRLLTISIPFHQPALLALRDLGPLFSRRSGSPPPFSNWLNKGIYSMANHR